MKFPREIDKVGSSARKHDDHPNLSLAINKNIRESEVMGGWWIRDLPRIAGEHDGLLIPGRMLKIRTRNTQYYLKHDPTNSNWMLIKGHTRYCPDWTTCKIAGSTWGGSMLKMGYVGVGMCLEFSIFSAIDGLFEGSVTTSFIQEIEECAVVD